MKLIQVPDVNDVLDLGVFKTAISEINLFNKSLTDFGMKILNDKFLFSKAELKEFLSEADYDRLEVKNLTYGTYLFDYVNKSICGFDVWQTGWTMGESTGKSITVEFSDCAEILIVTQRWKTKTARFDHIPWIPKSRIFYIDFVAGSILSKAMYDERISIKNEDDAKN